MSTSGCSDLIFESASFSVLGLTFDANVGLSNCLLSLVSQTIMWLLLMLVTGSLASPALWADEVDSEELVGTRWAEKDAEGEQPKQEGWVALRGEVAKLEDEVTREEDVANHFQRHQLPALDVLESRAAKDPSENKKEEFIVPDGPDVKHAKETRMGEVEKESQVNFSGKGDEVGNLTRQLEVVAFPVGVAIGAIGAAIWPSVFPERTTTTTTTAASAVVGCEDVDVCEDEGRDPTTTTTPRFCMLPLHRCSVETKIQSLVLF